MLFVKCREIGDKGDGPAMLNMQCVVKILSNFNKSRASVVVDNDGRMYECVGIDESLSCPKITDSFINLQVWDRLKKEAADQRLMN